MKIKWESDGIEFTLDGDLKMQTEERLYLIEDPDVFLSHFPLFQEQAAELTRLREDVARYENARVILSHELTSFRDRNILLQRKYEELLDSYNDFLQETKKTLTEILSKANAKT